MATSADTGPSFDSELKEAVDLLVGQHGAKAAEAELQRRLIDREPRSLPALSYLRYRYGGDLE